MSQSDSKQNTGTGSSKTKNRTFSSSGSNNRRFINYILQPFIQMRIGMYSNVLALVFCVSISAIAYHFLGEVVTDTIQLTDMEEEITEVAAIKFSSMKGWLFVTCLGFFTLNMILSIYYTHRMVGPTVAFRRHIRNLSDKKYDSRIYLRKNDAFQEVANDLNRLAHIMSQDFKDIAEEFSDDNDGAEIKTHPDLPQAKSS